jgi:hypothetical protein
VLIAVRIQEGRPKIRGQGLLELKIPSYSLFRNVARAAIEELGMRRSRDRDMGFPLPGSPAEERYFPQRFEERRKDSQRRQRASAREGAGESARARATADVATTGDVKTPSQSAPREARRKTPATHPAG